MKAIILSTVCSLGLLLAGCGSEPTAAPTSTAATIGNTSTVTTTTTTATTTVTKPTVSAGVCPDDLQRCSDGTAVSRNPENGCQFDACPAGKAM